MSERHLHLVPPPEVNDSPPLSSGEDLKFQSETVDYYIAFEERRSKDDKAAIETLRKLYTKRRGGILTEEEGAMWGSVCMMLQEAGRDPKFIVKMIEDEYNAGHGRPTA